MNNLESSQSSMPMSRNGSEANCIDPLDSLIDFSQYDDMNYQSPSVSPTDTKNLFVQPEVPTSRANSILPSQQTLSGPSHPYDMHKQQTGLPIGGVATTMAINSNQQMYAGYGYLSGVSSENDFVDMKFPSNPSSGSFDSVNMENFEGPVDAGFYFPPLPTGPVGQEFVKPSNLVASNTDMQPQHQQQQQQPGRLFPGMHQQQALVKAQQHQRQQHQQRVMHQQRQGSVARPAPQQKSKVRPSTDPIVEEKISQLLNSMRQNSMASTANDEDGDTPNNGHGHRSRKDEEDMDEDERLLASEEGKKLSSKERRQLRNKVSARAFRSRRKEYIGQLEGEIAGKVEENQRLYLANKALTEENDRLTDLTRLLLGSPAFSTFLNELSNNPTVIPQQQRQQPTPPQQVEQRQPEGHPNQVRKDLNPYTAQQQQNQNQDMNINFAIMPEQPMDFSMLDLVNNDFIYQPQVFSVHSVPEFTFDSSILSGKPSQETYVEDDKETLPLFAPAKRTDIVIEEAEHIVDEEFDSNPQFELFTSAATACSSTEAAEKPLDIDAIVANIKPAKAFLNFELVNSTGVEKETTAAMRRVRRLCSSLDAVTKRLNSMSMQ